MPAEQDPYARVYDVDQDDFGDNLAHEDLIERDEFGFEELGCCFLSHCCMPVPHYPSDCVSVEMMEDLFDEANADSTTEAEDEAVGEPDATDRPVLEPEGDLF